ncbi:MAG: glycosyltransferase [Oscillospiraceae bacterium]|nr:glycosyltransferase [Oscillospiraceae bacterium]
MTKERIEMRDGLISVIVPVYNVEEYLAECLDSILDQTYRNLEIILVNDGSTDSSGDICEHYRKMDDRIRVIYQENKGVSSARNLGIDSANGQWIAFVDSDDGIKPDMYEKLLHAATQSGKKVVCCDFSRFASDMEALRSSTSTKKFPSWTVSSEKYLKMILKGRTHSGVYAKIYCADLFYGEGALRFDESCYFGEDGLLTFCIAGRIDGFTVLSEGLYLWRTRSGSLTTTALNERKFSIYDAVERFRIQMEQTAPRIAHMMRLFYIHNIVNFLLYSTIGDSRQEKQRYRSRLRKKARRYAGAYLLSTKTGFIAKARFVLAYLSPELAVRTRIVIKGLRDF